MVLPWIGLAVRVPAQRLKLAFRLDGYVAANLYCRPSPYDSKFDGGSPVDPFIKRILWGFVIISVISAVVMLYMVLAGQGKAPAIYDF